MAGSDCEGVQSQAGEWEVVAPRAERLPPGAAAGRARCLLGRCVEAPNECAEIFNKSQPGETKGSSKTAHSSC